VVLLVQIKAGLTDAFVPNLAVRDVRVFKLKMYAICVKPLVNMAIMTVLRREDNQSGERPPSRHTTSQTRELAQWVMVRE